jgi:hypothetical protein
MYESKLNTLKAHAVEVLSKTLWEYHQDLCDIDERVEFVEWSSLDLDNRSACIKEARALLGWEE